MTNLKGCKIRPLVPRHLSEPVISVPAIWLQHVTGSCRNSAQNVSQLPIVPEHAWDPFPIIQHG